MVIPKILYNQYTIIIFISLIITAFTYFIIKNNDSDETQAQDKQNIIKTLLIVFVSTFVSIFGLKYIISYMNNNNYFQKGGLSTGIRTVTENIDINENLTIIGDDIEVDLFNT